MKSQARGARVPVPLKAEGSNAGIPRGLLLLRTFLLCFLFGWAVASLISGAS